MDLSRMSWQDRINYYHSLETVEGYVESIRLVDFHHPDYIQLSEVWCAALQEHPEMARDIYDKASRLVTILPEVWKDILAAHSAAFKMADPSGQASIVEAMGLIMCFRVNEPEDGEHCLASLKNSDYAQWFYIFEFARSNRWRDVEQCVGELVRSRLIKQVRSRLLYDREMVLERAHVLADYAIAVGEFERALFFLSNSSRTVSDDAGLKYRMAILYRDQKKWILSVDMLDKLIGMTQRLEDKQDFLNEQARIFLYELKMMPMAGRALESLIALDPKNIQAYESLVWIYESQAQYSRLIDVLKKMMECVDDDYKRAVCLFKLAKSYEKMGRACRYFDCYREILNIMRFNWNERDHEEALFKLIEATSANVLDSLWKRWKL